ncbi:YidC/Oxa1 family membrane protein insertase [Stackebrandtia nassauensis]|uniref:Membrane protein insertase YidC n=1 Tax=Stackebrandtia nassauensis (strain DSM 44728 / CIP 108903 / NRRL B-16338 / NBRC 102104 / LLR-40K-21) TaxID=446470 RepID=D3Q3A3_STANL|nr:membrane protein insertase YidC [Stackebrandtia nassauensis]ADD41944.1 60 kDa inner membrane insertion protein [Stackebrandtia nassauensis DSM 44728]
MYYLLSVVLTIADALRPLFAASATAAAIVVFTIAVRLLLHPLSRAAVRGEKTRQRLAPKMAELKRRHGDDRQRLVDATGELYRTEGSTPLTGCLPMLLQLPVFFVMYRLFTTDSISGAANPLLDDTLAGTPLGQHLSETLAAFGLASVQTLVFGVLLVALAAVALWTYRRTRRGMADSPNPPEGPAAAVARVMPLLSFGTLIVAAIVPLAAGIYLLATTTWTVTERAWLQGRSAS